MQILGKEKGTSYYFFCTDRAAFLGLKMNAQNETHETIPLIQYPTFLFSQNISNKFSSPFFKKL